MCLSATGYGRRPNLAILVAAVGAIFLLLADPGSATAESKRVLFLHSFGRDFAPFNEFTSLFREQLIRHSPDPIDLYEASLDSARYSDPQDETPLTEYLRSVFANRRLDLVVTTGGPAARFIQKYRPQLFPNAPMLITAVEQRNVASGSVSANDTVLAVNINFHAVIANILQLLPETKNVAVVLGNSPFEQFWLAENRREFQPYMDRINFIWLNQLSFDEMRRQIASLPANTAIYVGLYMVDATGVAYPGDRLLNELHAYANAPIFTFVDTSFGRGIVGGPLISYKSLSRLSVDAAIRILRGEKPGDIKPVILDMESPKYDWRELRRWNISESRLPAGSVVDYREPTLWEQYRWQISAISATTFVQALIIAWLLVERHRRHRAEMESRSRFLEVTHLNRTAAAGALSASIAHELNQPLGAILSNTDAAELLLAANPPKLGRVKEILSDIRLADQRASEILHRVRKLLKPRSKIELQEFDLNDAISEALHVLSPEALKRGITLKTDGLERTLPVRADQIHLQQVIVNLAANGMDAMANVASEARVLTVDTALNGHSTVVVSVADQGTGIPSGKLKDVFDTFYTTKEQGTGLGLSIARTIVETYGGKIWAENGAAGGAVFRFTFPLTKQEPT